MKSLKSKRAQVWSLDVIIASVIFVSGLVVLYVYAVNFDSGLSDDVDELFYETNLASELILSEDVSGILYSGKVDQSKLDVFNGLTQQQQKSLLGIKNNFYFTMDGLESPEGNPIGYVGDFPSGNTRNLVQVTRLTVYKNKPVKFLIYVWN